MSVADRSRSYDRERLRSAADGLRFVVAGGLQKVARKE